MCKSGELTLLIGIDSGQHWIWTVDLDLDGAEQKEGRWGLAGRNRAVGAVVSHDRWRGARWCKAYGG